MASENAQHCDNCKKSHVPITLRDLFWQDPFFSTNWEDFGSLHDQMLAETKNFWGKFDRQLKRLESKEETSGSVKHESATSSSTTTAAKSER